MEKDAKEALQVTKEVMVKFIETGRVSPTNFAEIFPGVYRVVLETITRPGYAWPPATQPGAPEPGGPKPDERDS